VATQNIINESRPPRARGLKRDRRKVECTSLSVAPPAGAWIETGKCRNSCIGHIVSRPPRARGLKRVITVVYCQCHWSRPPRARGLKHYTFVHINFSSFVAPPAGAWIETSLRVGGAPVSNWSRPPRARGLKHGKRASIGIINKVAPPAGAWIETTIYCTCGILLQCRAPRGRVD